MKKVLFILLACVLVSCSSNSSNNSSVKQVDIFDECERVAEQNPSLSDTEIVRIVVCDPALAAGAEFAKKVGSTGIERIQEEAERMFSARFSMPKETDPTFTKAFDNMKGFYKTYFERGYKEELGID